MPKTARPEQEVLLDVERARRGVRVRRAGALPRQPRRGAPGLFVRPRRRRGLRVALPGPGDGRDLHEVTPEQLLRRRLERGLGVLLLHRPRRALPAPTRSGGTYRHPLPSDVLVQTEPDDRFELTVRATRSGDLRRDRGGEPGHAEVWLVDAPPPRRAPGRSASAGAGCEYHSEHVDHAGRWPRCPSSPTTTRPSSGSLSAARCRATPTRSTPWTAAAPRGPGGAVRRLDAFAGHVVLVRRVAGQLRLRLLPLDGLDWGGGRRGPGVLPRAR